MSSRGSWRSGRYDGATSPGPGQRPPGTSARAGRLPSGRSAERRAAPAADPTPASSGRTAAIARLSLQLHFWRGVLIFSRMVGRGWMSGASIEETLELWAASLREVKGRMRPLFTQERVAASAGLFLDGLLGEERRKTGWMRAEAAGDPGPWRQQAILGRGRWDADALRDIVREYALEHLADEDAVLVVDETGFLKQGKASCGVA